MQFVVFNLSVILLPFLHGVPQRNEFQMSGGVLGSTPFQSEIICCFVQSLFVWTAQQLFLRNFTSPFS